MELKRKRSFSWEEVDKYVVYAQEHNQKTIATIWPHANWEQKSCKRKKLEVHLKNFKIFK